MVISGTPGYMASCSNTLARLHMWIFWKLKIHREFVIFQSMVPETVKFNIYSVEIASLSPYFAASVWDCMTDNLKSKSLCDPAKNYTMPFYSYFTERNHI